MVKVAMTMTIMMTTMVMVIAIACSLGGGPGDGDGVDGHHDEAYCRLLFYLPSKRKIVLGVRHLALKFQLCFDPLLGLL